MYKNILLCTDGSEQSLYAARAAAEIARQLGTQLTLLSVFDDTAACTPYLGAWQMGVDPEALMRCAAEGRGVHYELIQRIGHPAQTIVQAAEESRADLIVVGSRGMGTFKSLLLGSVSDRVLHHAHCPVLIVR